MFYGWNQWTNETHLAALKILNIVHLLHPRWNSNAIWLQCTSTCFNIITLVTHPHEFKIRLFETSVNKF